MTNLSRLRKKLLDAEATTDVGNDDEIDIVGCATIAYSSENPAHPIGHLFDGHSGLGGTLWISARPDTVERVIVKFDELQPISRLVYEVEEAVRERTQEVRVEVSENGGRTYRQILVQEYNFSPRGTTYQREELRFNRLQANRLRFTIVPNKNGSGTATLTALRLFAQDRGVLCSPAPTRGSGSLAHFEHAPRPSPRSPATMGRRGSAPMPGTSASTR
jgi:F5/8 type C domain